MRRSQVGGGRKEEVKEREEKKEGKCEDQVGLAA